MKIIEEAFDEGRNTDTDWENSKAKQNSIKLEVELENFSMFSKKDNYKVIPLQKICPETGKVLATFTSRLEAANHICNEILKNPNKNPISVTGNMEMCMRAGWKAYGFYRKICDAEVMLSETRPSSSAKALYCLDGTKTIFFNSIKEASEFLNRSTDYVSYRLKPLKSCSDGLVKIKKNFNNGKNVKIGLYNPSKKMKHIIFNNKTEMSQWLKVAVNHVSKYENRVINNFKLHLKGK